MRAFPLLATLLLCLALAPADAAPTVVSPIGVIVIDKAAGGVPSIFLLPLNWGCVRAASGGPGYVALVGDALASGETITCGHWGNLLQPCLSATASGTSQTSASGATVSATSACGAVSATVSLPGPGATDSKTTPGLDAYFITCTPAWTALHANDAWTVECQVN